MRQIREIFLFDVKMNAKTFMGIYMIIVPAIILIVLRSFLPTFESTSATIAVVTEGINKVETEMILALEEIVDVKEYKSIEAMEQKLRGTGTVEGLYWDPGIKQYVSVLERSIEGNRIFSLAARIIRQHYYRKIYPEAPRVTTFNSSVPAELSDRTKTSPVATMGGSIFLVFMIMVNGFFNLSSHFKFNL